MNGSFCDILIEYECSSRKMYLQNQANLNETLDQVVLANEKARFDNAIIESHYKMAAK